MARPGWFSDYSRHYGLKPDDTGAEEAAFLLKVLCLRHGQAVLDAPCGAGRIAAHLARAGLNVTGVDLTRPYIRRARRRFRHEGLRGDFSVRDLRDMDFEEEFDGAFNWQGSFGFFREEENQDVIRRYARALRRGGRLVIDQPAREWLLRHWRGAGGEGITFRALWRPTTQRTVTTFRNVKTGQSWSMTIRHYTPAQYRRLFEAAGLRLEAIYCDLGRTPYHRGARRIYLVGRKV